MKNRKPRPQFEKRIDGMPETEYAAGKGIEIEGKEIRLKPAQKGDSDFLDNLLGGVWIPYFDSGLNLDDNGRLRLATASSGYKGGIYIGDGLLSANGVCSVDIGKGMRFNDRDDREYPNNISRGRSVSPNLGDGLKSDPSEDETEPDYGKIHLNLGSGLTFGERIYEKKKDSEGNDTEEDDPTRYTSVVELKLGTGLRFGENGELIAEGGTGGGSYKAGENITISEDGTISAQVKEYTAGENITISEDGEISSTGEGLTIGQAVIIKEEDAKYLLHDFTEIEYIAGNKIGYAGPGNQIVVQGFIAYPYAVLNEGTSSSSNSIWYYPENGVPSFSRYSEISAEFYSSDARTTYKKSYLKQTATTPNAGTYSWLITRADDVDAVQKAGLVNQNHWSGIGLLLEWLDIYPPGYTAGGKAFEYGCANVRFHYIRKSNTDAANGKVYERTRVNTNYVFPFTSLAEYQAAVGLTYEPLTLTRVEDNPTVVSGKGVT